jgi:DNA-binding MarR family transcriptional regulator
MAFVLKIAQPSPASVPQPDADTALGRTVDRLMRTIEELVHHVPGADSVRLDQLVLPQPEPPELSEQEVALTNANLLIAMRKLRERAFGADLFSDPAWSILIELYVALSEDTPMSVGNACIASALPLTSALRLCQQLQERKIVIRERDSDDRRRVLLRLSDTAYQALTHVLAGTRLHQRG